MPAVTGVSGLVVSRACPADRETARAIKEKLGYVACDYEGELKWAGSVTKDFTLPNGEVNNTTGRRVPLIRFC